MDVWIVAVAAGAGAGYAVQNLKNLTRAKKKCLDLSSKNLSIAGLSSTNIRQKVEDKRCPLKKVLSRKCSREEISEERENFCKDACDIESASISGHENENLVSPHSIQSDSISLGEILNNEDVEGGRKGVLSFESNEAFMVGSPSLPSTSEVGFCYSNERNRNSSLKSRRIDIQSLKPQTSLESCLMAQYYEDQCKIDEYALQKPTMRPFLVTDGSSIISRTHFKSFSEATGVGREFQKWKDVYSDQNKTVHGIPRLPNLETAELQNKVNNRNREEQGFRRSLSSKIEHGHHDSAQGTSDRALLFYLGLNMGIISSIFANKQEVEKLKNLLKQSENLAQDLQEELEMKDSLTVKELATEDNESEDVLDDHCFDDTVHALSLEHNLIKENCVEKAEMKSLSNIEAELEAELQRLELNMSSSSSKGKLCNLTEVNPDLASDVPESRSDLFGANTVNLFYDGREKSHTSTPRSAHYSVSPRELSLRLHQFIQTRLEERVKELETALENSERKIKYMESGHIHPWWDSSNCKTGTFSTKVSPVSRDGQDSVDQPITVNFEALTSNSEAYEGFKKVSEPDDKGLKIGFKDEYLFENGHLDPHSTCNGNRETVIDQRTEEDDCCPSNDIEEGEDDEMERLLIMQIVEKAKQGSHAVLKAKTAFLLSNDEIQQ